MGWVSWVSLVQVMVCLGAPVTLVQALWAWSVKGVDQGLPGEVVWSVRAAAASSSALASSYHVLAPPVPPLPFPSCPIVTGASKLPWAQGKGFPRAA